MSIRSGYEEQLKVCSTFTCSLSTRPWCACCLHAQIQYHHCIDKGKPDREERQEVCQEFPTANGCLWLLGVGSLWRWGTLGRPLVFLLSLSLACPCLCNDDIESEHADNRHTGGGYAKLLHKSNYSSYPLIIHIT